MPLLRPPCKSLKSPNGRHKWSVIEKIGKIITEKCDYCNKTRTRIEK